MGIAYRDWVGNMYRVERASNGAFIVARKNGGGNRKGYRPLGVRSKEAAMQSALDAFAAKNGWKQEVWW